MRDPDLDTRVDPRRWPARLLRESEDVLVLASKPSGLGLRLLRTLFLGGGLALLVSQAVRASLGPYAGAPPDSVRQAIAQSFLGLVLLVLGVVLPRLGDAPIRFDRARGLVLRGRVRPEKLSGAARQRRLLDLAQVRSVAVVRAEDEGEVGLALRLVLANGPRDLRWIDALATFEARRELVEEARAIARFLDLPVSVPAGLEGDRPAT